MTDDIVIRLRGYDFMRDGDIPDVIMSEAADEIERLRAENDGLRVRIYSLLNKLDEQAVRG